jgi:aarF domain-containing kinase
MMCTLPAGPAFIKWGQWAATRHDLFPPDMCSELELLHTKVGGRLVSERPVPWLHICQVTWQRHCMTAVLADCCDAPAPLVCLTHCFTQAPAHHFRFTKSAIHHSFGMPHTELFDWFEHHPVASGSIGQIHRARLSEKGAALTGVCGGGLTRRQLQHTPAS